LSSGQREADDKTDRQQRVNGSDGGQHPMAFSLQSLQSAEPQRGARTAVSGSRRAGTRRCCLRLQLGLLAFLLAFAPPLVAADSALAAELDAEVETDGLRWLDDISVDIRPAEGELPDDPAAARFAALGEDHHVFGTNRPWPLSCHAWEAPAVCHRPLYFEEPNLERHGWTHGIAQPLVSAAHFFGTIPALPYLMAAEPCRRCVYTLGHDRPGSCAPYRLHRPPLSLRGAAAEAAVVTGLIWAIP
jgi:hypothetical protein